MNGKQRFPPALWPNYICVLEVGVIHHQGKAFEICLGSNEITAAAWPTYLAYDKDSLFKFFCALHDMCAHMQLGPVELTHYYDPPARIGKYLVSSRVEQLRFAKDDEAVQRRVRLTEAAINRVVEWCFSHGKMPYEDILRKQFGSLPLGMDDMRILQEEVFLYDPSNLPGLHEIGSNIMTMTEHGPRLAPCLANALALDIDGQRYMIEMSSFTDTDFENI